MRTVNVVRGDWGEGGYRQRGRQRAAGRWRCDRVIASRNCALNVRPPGMNGGENVLDSRAQKRRRSKQEEMRRGCRKPPMVTWTAVGAMMTDGWESVPGKRSGANGLDDKGKKTGGQRTAGPTAAMTSGWRTSSLLGRRARRQQRSERWQRWTNERETFLRKRRAACTTPFTSTMMRAGAGDDDDDGEGTGQGV